MKWSQEEIRTFAYLYSAADWALEQAEAAEDRQMFPSMHTILSSIHCLEAFANHLGPRYFGEKWDRKGSELSRPKEKLKALLEELGISLSEVQKEYDSYILGLNVRKQLTHGKTHESSDRGRSGFCPGSIVSKTRPDWEKQCEPKTARRVFEAVTMIIETLGEASGEGKFCWAVLGRGVGWEEHKG